ncbi:MAG: hypothetical protein JWM57_819, partial [Phycisphaerales bacterium]|nr:hypothetical protein [Phycisphaerales bacterium]
RLNPIVVAVSAVALMAGCSHQSSEAANAATTTPATVMAAPVAVAVAVAVAVDKSSLVSEGLTDPAFFSRLDTDPQFYKDVSARLASNDYRKLIDTRSVRVQLWRGTTLEEPAVVVEYQTAWKQIMGLQNRGPAQYDPVLTGTGRDNMLYRTVYGGTEDARARAEFKGMAEARLKLPSNKRTSMDTQFVDFAEKHLPTKPLADVRAEVLAKINQLVADHKADGAHVLENPAYGHFGAKISDHLYIYIRDFATETDTRFEHDPFFWVIFSGGPKAQPANYLPSFPGAEGMGAQATGGRGGKVIYVTNTNPDGPGSYKEALLTKCARTILFKVSGQIELPDPTWIREPNLTVIGYTAPGEGIEIKGRLNIAASNVILRGMRYRLRPPLEQDGMNTEGNLTNIIFDHCSFAYDSDEAIRFIGNGSTFLGFTIQYCILGPGLAGLNAHPYGPEVGGYGSFHHNVFYSTLSRSPEVDCDLIDWSYNIMANLRSGHSLRPQSRFNLTNNYMVAIPSNPNQYEFEAGDSVYAENNLLDAGGKVTPFQTKHVGTTAFLKAPYRVVPLTHDDPKTLQDKLVPIAGAFLPKRDATDTFFLKQLVDRTLKLPFYDKSGKQWTPYGNQNNNMDLYEKWDEAKFPPPAAGATAEVDSDGDGMPDAWELAHGLDPKDPADGAADSDHDGYTNLEEFLNHTDPQQFVDYKKPENNIHTLNNLAK